MNRTIVKAKVARSGFTLIELLIVLAILVLLATLVAPRLLGSREKAQSDSTKTQISMFKSSLEMYSLHMSSYPSTDQGLQALIEPPSTNSIVEEGTDEEFDLDEVDEDTEEVNSSWQGPYIKADRVPKDPWAFDYRYEYPPNNNKFGEPDIWSLGPDGKDNTEDDIVSWTGERGNNEDEEDISSEGFDTTDP